MPYYRVSRLHPAPLPPQATHDDVKAKDSLKALACWYRNQRTVPAHWDAADNYHPSGRLAVTVSVRRYAPNAPELVYRLVDGQPPEKVTS